jgi:LysM repeat protein
MLITFSRIQLVSFCLLMGFGVMAQGVDAQPSEYRLSRKEYINTYKEEAVREMLRAGIPASITLAQGILESADGNSPLAKYANNHFGIKCHKGWTGERFIMDDDTKNECFRKYYSVYDSYRDHSDFLTGRSRYAALFELKITDYKGWAKGLKKAGYATNPKYADILIKIIEDNELDQYDKVKKVPKREPETKPIAIADKLDPHDRAVRLQNNIKYTVVKQGDSFYKIANEMDMGLWQLYKYNDMRKGDQLEAGQVLYLQPKRSKGTEEVHQVKKGDNMWMISQMYGIRLKKLYKRNGLESGTEPVVGSTLFLRKNKR